MTTTLGSATELRISNATFDELRQALDPEQSPVLCDVFTQSKNYKGHSRAVQLDDTSANALRALVSQARTSENEARMKTVTDKLDAAFPDSATAVAEPPDEADEQIERDDEQQPEQAATETPVAEPTRAEPVPVETPQSSQQQPVPNVPEGQADADGVFRPDLGRTPLKAVRMAADRSIPDISETALVIELPDLLDLGAFSVDHAKTGIVRYRSKSRSSGGFVSVVDVTHEQTVHLKQNLPEHAQSAKAMVVCELHELGAALPSVDPGKLYLRQPEKFCASCRTHASEPKPAPEPKQAGRRGRKPKNDEPAALDARVVVVADADAVDNEQPSNASESVIHPSDERAPTAAWEVFAGQLASEQNAEVQWLGDRHYGLNYAVDGATKLVDVYVSNKGVEHHYRADGRNFDSLSEAKEALGIA